ncbi:MAG: hypothetical protein CMP22_04385 [Rickettsiales bacterium]|nr:hypothetical protein [Rickettsiales bacterium]
MDLGDKKQEQNPVLEDDKPVGTDLDLLAKILESTGDISYVWHINESKVDWSGPIHDTLGLDLDTKITFATINQRINPQDLPNRLQHIHSYVSEKKSYVCDYRVRRHNGETIWLRETGMVDQSNPEKIKFYGLLRDITAEKDQIENLKVIAYVDSWTNMPNREGVRLVLEEDLDHNMKTSQIGTFFSVGIDRLNVIEEAYGSDVTEDIFTKVAHRLDDYIGKDGKVGILSGDVFGVILPKVDETTRRYRAFEIMKHFSNNPILTDVGPLRITLSVGSVEFPQQSFNAHGLIQRGEASLAQARKFGQSAYYAYDFSQDKQDAFRHWIVTGEHFVEAVRDDRIALAFQSVIDYEKNENFFHESLIRMIDKQGQVIPAGMFIPAVEKMGLCRLADIHAVTLAIHELMAYPDIRLSVNISGMTIMDEEWLGIVENLLKSNTSVAERLIIEITETAAMQSVSEAIKFIEKMHKLGCKVALDDFGAGQTSFSQLDKLDIDLVKIDGAFVQGMEEKEQNKLFLQALHMLADGFGLDTVAEGVETMDVADILKADGISNLQGYAFSKPVIERVWLSTDNEERYTLENGKLDFQNKLIS